MATRPAQVFIDNARLRDWDEWTRVLSKDLPRELRYSACEIDPIDDATLGFQFEARTSKGQLVLTRDEHIDEAGWRTVNVDVESFGKDLGYGNFGVRMFKNRMNKARDDKMDLHARASFVGAALWPRMGGTLYYPEPADDAQYTRQKEELDKLLAHVQRGYDEAEMHTLVPIPDKAKRGLDLLADIAHEGWAETREEERALWGIVDDTVKVQGRSRGAAALLNATYAMQIDWRDWGVMMRLRKYMDARPG